MSHRVQSPGNTHFFASPSYMLLNLDHVSDSGQNCTFFFFAGKNPYVSANLSQNIMGLAHIETTQKRVQERRGDRGITSLRYFFAYFFLMRGDDVCPKNGLHRKKERFDQGQNFQSLYRLITVIRDMFFSPPVKSVLII